jgi:hypothetical protein
VGDSSRWGVQYKSLKSFIHCGERLINVWREGSKEDGLMKIWREL